MISRAQFSAHLRQRMAWQILDDSRDDGGKVAVYTLSDPRDLRDVRYVGQTRSPANRYRQHVNKASPWLPDELPWWMKAPRDRPLHEWIRGLDKDGARLPFMIIVAWYADTPAARSAESALIRRCLQEKLQILNVEAQIAQRAD